MAEASADDRAVDQALERIEAALARIERAAGSGTVGAADLRERHEKLQSAVSRSLRQLDALIGEDRS